LAIEALVERAGLPRSLVSFLVVDQDVVHSIIPDRRIAAVTVTGSPRAGRAVAASAGAALKKVVLELGGSDPYLILEGADLDKAVEACALSRLVNSGQSCIAAKRIITVPSVHDEFCRRFVARMSEAVVGDPREPQTQVGPLARVDLRDQLHQQIQDSVAGGATLLLGGQCPDGAGAWYPVTVLADVEPGMPAFDEELFGPAVGIIRAKDESDAIMLANRSCFGLGAAVFAGDRERAELIAEQKLEAGCCFVNDWVKSDPRLPFGGIRESGYGRELGPLGIHEFMNAKTISIE
jgi:succinate-semialdehyde dehydrogenase/glutarate-semialdehyde dehydrogenase